MQAPRESSIVASILRWLNRQPGVKAVKTHGGPLGAGQPDITGCIRGRRFDIEVKRPGGKPTKLQLRRLKEWEEAGSIVGVVYSLDEAKELLGPYLGSDSP